jgi:hypothetical protein
MIDGGCPARFTFHRDRPGPPPTTPAPTVLTRPTPADLPLCEAASGAAPSDAASAETGSSGTADGPVLCNHCGRTASNGLVCIGMCVADSGY